MYEKDLFVGVPVGSLAEAAAILGRFSKAPVKAEYLLGLGRRVKTRVGFEFEGRLVETGRLRFEPWGSAGYVGFEALEFLGPLSDPVVLDVGRMGRLLEAVRKVWPEAQFFLGSWES